MNRSVDAAVGIFPFGFLILLGLLIYLGFATKLSPPLGAWRRCLVTISAPLCLALSLVVLVALESQLEPAARDILMTIVLGPYVSWAAIVQLTVFVIGFASINIWSLAGKTAPIGLMLTLMIVGAWTMVTMHLAVLVGLAADCVGTPVGQDGCF